MDLGLGLLLCFVLKLALLFRGLLGARSLEVVVEMFLFVID